MTSTATGNPGPGEQQTGLMTRLVRRFDAMLAMGLLAIIGVFAVNSLVKRDPSLLSHREIRQMLAKDAARINLFVTSIEKIPKEVATILGLQRLREEEIQIILNSILMNSPELFGTAVAFAPNAFDREKDRALFYDYRKGETIGFTTLNDPGYDYFNKDWYLLPKILGHPVWVDPYFDDGGGGIFMTTFAVPFSFFDGVKESFTGIVTVDVSIDWLTRNFSAGKTLPNQGYVMLLSENGTIISAPNKEWEVNHTIFSLATFLKMPELRRIGRELQRGRSGDAAVISPNYKKPVQVFFAPVPANRWGILYVVPDKADT